MSNAGLTAHRTHPFILCFVTWASWNLNVIASLDKVLVEGLLGQGCFRSEFHSEL